MKYFVKIGREVSMLSALFPLSQRHLSERFRVESGIERWSAGLDGKGEGKESKGNRIDVRVGRLANSRSRVRLLSVLMHHRSMN